MSNLEQEKLFELYTLAEIAYNNHFKDLVEYTELLYPSDWYAKNNYKEKIQIIGEAIKQNQLIMDIPKYND